MPESRGVVRRVAGTVGARMVAWATGRRQFAAAVVNRLTGGWFSGTTSAKQDHKGSLRVLRDRARTVARDTAVGKRYARLFVENVVGTGIVLKPQVKTAGDEFDRAANAAIASAWAAWSAPGTCTMDGLTSWMDTLRQIVETEPTDGEVLLRIVRGPAARNPYNFAVQILDADQLDLGHSVELPDGAKIVQGVELDRWGRPVAYHLWDGHPADTGRGVRRRVPASDVVHYFQPHRPGAVRGVPRLHAALKAVDMLGGYLEAELVAARTAAAKMGWFEPTADAEADPDQPQAVPMEATPGSFGFVPTGHSFKAFDPQHPTAAFGQFYAAVLREIAAAGSVAYTSLSGDLTAVNYSSIRAGLFAERDAWRIEQQRLITHVCTRVYREWLRMALASGAIAGYGLRDFDRLAAHGWQPRGWPWVDPSSELAALEKEIALGLNSRTRAAAERGRDLEDVLAELDAESQLGAEYGVAIGGTPLAGGGSVAAPAVDATALSGILAQVQAGTLAEDAARPLLAAAYPTLAPDAVDAMLSAVLSAAADRAGAPMTQTTLSVPVPPVPVTVQLTPPAPQAVHKELIRDPKGAIVAVVERPVSTRALPSTTTHTD